MPLKKPITFEAPFTTYTATDIIDGGGAGLVYLATDDAGQVRAIKVLKPDVAKSSEKLKRFKNELEFLSRNRHPNIITALDSGLYIDGKNRSPFYVMPLYDGSLRSLINRGILPQEVLRYFAQVLDGVEAAHLQQVIHRDLKPENVLYDRSHDSLVIADFGIAHFEEDALFTAVETSPHSRLANFQYAAPEQRARGGTVDQRADIFALGLLLNEMYTREVPWGTDFRSIATVAPEFVYLDALVASMIRQKAEERLPSIEAVKQGLIGHRAEFVARQRVSTLTQTVVPVTEIDDPLILDPPRLINAVWNRGQLTLILSQRINTKWQEQLHNMRQSYGSMYGREPSSVSFSGDRTTIRVDEFDAQRFIDYFKTWLPIANQQYERVVRDEKLRGEQEVRNRLQREIENEEARVRVTKRLQI